MIQHQMALIGGDTRNILYLDEIGEPAAREMLKTYRLSKTLPSS
jgi:hypothetical protein